MTAAFGGLLAWTLSSGWAAEIVRARLITSVGKDLAAELEPGYPDQNPVTLPGGIEYNRLEIDPMIESAAGPFMKRGL